MKRTILSPTTFAIIAAALLVGCTTTTTQTITPGLNGAPAVTNNVTTKIPDVPAICMFINLTVPAAVTFAPQQDRVYLQDAATVLTVFAGGTNLSPAALDAALASTKVKELQTPQVQSAITTLVLSYQAAYSQTVAAKLPQAQYLAPILQAIASSIQVGLTLPPASVGAPTSQPFTTQAQ